MKYIVDNLMVQKTKQIMVDECAPKCNADNHFEIRLGYVNEIHNFGTIH